MASSLVYFLLLFPSSSPYLVGARGVAGGAVWAPSKPVPRAGSLERPGVRGEDADDDEGWPPSLMFFFSFDLFGRGSDGFIFFSFD